MPPHLTLRQRLNQQQKHSLHLALAGFGVFFLGLLSGVGAPRPPLWTFLGFAIFIAGILYRLLALKCSHCGNRLGCLTLAPGSGFSLSPRLRFCPFCGVSLDTPV